jgi:hypothetical protein
MIFVGLALLSLGVFVVLGLRLWRGAKAVGSDAIRGQERLAAVWARAHLYEND